MPVTLDFVEPNTFVVHCSGAVTFPEVQCLIGQFLAHPRMQCGAHVLVDGRAVVDAPSTSELRRIAADLRPLVERGVTGIAIVAGSSFIYGVARMFSVFAELFVQNVAAFRDLPEAEEWLGHLSVT